MDTNKVVSWEDDFEINEFGLMLITKLLELRINNDLKYTDRQIKDNKRELSKIPVDGILNKGKRLLKERKLEKLYEEKDIKSEWYKNWKININKKLEENKFEDYEDLTINNLVDIINQKDIANFKKYTILQEAVSIPIYTNNGDIAEKENRLQYSSKEISQLLGFNSNEGEGIIKNIEKFIKEVNGVWSKRIKYALLGGAILALASVACLPFIASGIGAIGGLSGAAALTHGLAVLGGGSIAAGGLGMAGGYSVIVGGGTILGLASGAAIGGKLKYVDDEYVLLSMAKVVNSINYLKNNGHTDISGIKNRVVNKFITIKHNLEKEILLSDEIRDYNQFKSKINIINYTYDKICKIL